MSILVSQILGSVTTLLQDASYSRWSLAELISWINMGQDQVVALKPDAMTITTPIKLAQGVTQQHLPDGTDAYQDPDDNTLRAGLKLIDITRNMGSNGTTPGKPISIIDRLLLDQCDPEWHSGHKSSTIQHYVYDEKNPRVFYITPGSHSLVYVWVEIIYTAKPNRVAQVTDSIDLPDEYESILVDYVLFRAYAKSTDSQLHLQKAVAYYEAFNRALGTYSMVEDEFDPNNTKGKPSPSVRR